MSYHGFEQSRRDCEIVRRSMSVLELFTQRREGSHILIVSVDVTQQAKQFLKSYRINSAVLFQAVFSPRTKLIEVPSGLGNADHRHVEMAALHHRLKCGKDLLISKVASRAEEYQSI